MYAATQDICNEMGMPSYEVSNHARDGAQSRHNLIYWRYGDYLGIGPGAHGRLTQNGHRFATECFSNPQRWLDAVQQGSGEKPRTQLSRDEQASELLLMGLRVKSGVSLDRYSALARRPIEAHKLEELTELGLLAASEKSLIVSDQGFMVLNGVLRKLLED